MNRFPLNYRAAGWSVRSIRAAVLRCNRALVFRRMSALKRNSFRRCERPSVFASQSRAAFSPTSVQDGLQIRGRTGNNTQYLARRRLLLQRFGKITVALAAIP